MYLEPKRLYEKDNIYVYVKQKYRSHFYLTGLIPHVRFGALVAAALMIWGTCLGVDIFSATTELPIHIRVYIKCIPLA